jgi:putative tryptophan/tyrosine transport system ATP-binding protein
MIAVENVSVTFGAKTPNETKALRGVSLTIETGQFVTVIGSNGSGKSTLLNSIAGEIPIGSGVVRIDGVDVTNSSAHERARLVARVFQDPLAGTCDSLTVEENMAMALGRGRTRWLRRAISKEHRARFRESLRNIGLDDRLEDKIGLLSGGQRQAISLTMATLAPSRVMLLDEHTAALDPRASEKVLVQTTRIVESTGLTTLMITHSMRDALTCGDRLIMLHQGKLVLDAVGDEKAKLTVPDLVDMFGRIKGAAADEDRMLLS